MADLGPNTYPDWHKGSVPSVEEWQRLFSLKLDNDRLISELANALAGASSTDMNALLAALIPDVTAGITASGNIITKAALASALAGYQPSGNYQPAGNYATQSALQGVLSALANYATAAALASETQRAEQAEAALLPLSGGQLTGNLLGSLGGVVPQVLGLTGRVVIQSFVAAGKCNSAPITTPFPQAFKPGTVPFVFIQTSPDWNNVAQIANIGNKSDNLTPNITNTNFVLWDLFAGSGVGFAGGGGPVAVPYQFQVLAIGVM